MNLAIVNGQPLFDGNTVFGSMLALYEAAEAGQLPDKDAAARFAQGYVESMDARAREAAKAMPLVPPIGAPTRVGR